MKTERQPADGDRSRGVIDMEREPLSAGGRFRLGRRAGRTRTVMPLWARLGLWLGWPVGAVLMAAAILAAVMACGFLALAVFLPTLAR